MTKTSNKIQIKKKKMINSKCEFIKNKSRYKKGYHHLFN